MGIVHSPANKPIAQQRIVRGDAILRLPGKGFGPGLPRFSWPGVVDSLDLSPEWAMDGAMTLLEAFVTMASDIEGIEFDILVNNVVIDTVTASAIDWQRYDINVPVVLNDRVRLEMVDFGDGTCDDLSVVLRPFITPGQEV